jgi:hypothetical protein
MVIEEQRDMIVSLKKMVIPICQMMMSMIRGLRGHTSLERSHYYLLVLAFLCECFT